jgi:hypothetical protein
MLILISIFPEIEIYANTQYVQSADSIHREEGNNCNQGPDFMSTSAFKIKTLFVWFGSI